MSDLWTLFTGLFKNAAQSSPTQPAEHKLIERSDDEIAAYERWKKTFVKQRLLQWINRQYANFHIEQRPTDEAIDFIRSASVQGFVIHFQHTGYSRMDAVFLLDYIKERVKTLPYKSSLSDVRTFARGKQVESVQKHYLKPRVQEVEKLIDQRYGNITAELILRDDKPYRLKFNATHYNDALYLPPSDFPELMGVLMRQ